MYTVFRGNISPEEEKGNVSATKEKLLRNIF
ncbi:hypothetical protein FUAX_41500 (plasmid) [Fulvitalea axinellae]|uniref:Uncharacterized protein n=1 Tax=Fulvitalea axinellae TaxID=1182444 RepID=A0AAU9CUJ4_9BACT|nr:hypothetical protein FUAX_41500 [Fulvitalea axinellae]